LLSRHVDMWLRLLRSGVEPATCTARTRYASYHRVDGGRPRRQQSIVESRRSRRDESRGGFGSGMEWHRRSRELHWIQYL